MPYGDVRLPRRIEFRILLLVLLPGREPRVVAPHRRDTPFSADNQRTLGLLWMGLTAAVRGASVGLVSQSSAPPAARER